MAESRYLATLRRYWGYDSFRGIQQEIIESIGAGHDTVGLMPTGGGKSITFQVPALANPGLCLVVTPLIALMQDQVMHLRLRGVKATAVYSGMTRQAILTALDNCILGGYKFLYVSPERLETELFLAKLRYMDVSFITVDEAHCISQWGYDFRPSYLRIARIRQVVPDAPVLALTATATPVVIDDIMKQLAFRDGRVLKMSFERKNLTYVVRRANDKLHELLHILRSVPGQAIVYTRSRQQTHDIARMLNEAGITATSYHAGLNPLVKDDRQDKWHREEYRVMVATNAFGMGIDKADVRLVIHVEIPSSPEEYFQEAGRAGRDGMRAFAVLIYNVADCTKLLRRVSETYPKPEYVRDVYEHLCFYFQMAMGCGEGETRELDLLEFCARFKYFPVNAHNALLLLNNAGYLDYTEEDEIRSRLRFVITRDSLYRIDEQTEEREVIIHSLLRKYSGLFADFVYIDETLLARDTGLTSDTVYHTLMALSRARIVDYIPRKRTNFITFVQQRVEKSEINLPPHVYRERRNQYEKRIKTMIEYVTDKEVCHSRFLLSYFGEHATHDCGNCDVCRAHKTDATTDALIRSSILRQLKASPLFANEMDTTGFSRESFARVASDMVHNEEIFLDEKQRLALREGSTGKEESLQQ